MPVRRSKGGKEEGSETWRDVEEVRPDFDFEKDGIKNASPNKGGRRKTSKKSKKSKKSKSRRYKK